MNVASHLITSFYKSTITFKPEVTCKPLLLLRGFISTFVNALIWSQHIFIVNVLIMMTYRCSLDEIMSLICIVWKSWFAGTHPEHLLHLGNAFDKDGAELVPDPCQEEPEERDAKYGIQDAEDLPSLRARGDVSISCDKWKRQKSNSPWILRIDSSALFILYPWWHENNINSRSGVDSDYITSDAASI